MHYHIFPFLVIIHIVYFDCTMGLLSEQSMDPKRTNLVSQNIDYQFWITYFRSEIVYKMMSHFLHPYLAYSHQGYFAFYLKLVICWLWFKNCDYASLIKPLIVYWMSFINNLNSLFSLDMVFLVLIFKSYANQLN